MPTHFKAQIAWQIGSLLPRDRFTIDPCFRHQDDLPFDSPDWQTMANDLRDGINGWALSPTNHQLTVKLYELDGPPPHKPKATAVANLNAANAPTYMQEIALCLSFYGGPNDARNRGRLYVPHVKCSNDAPANRPASTARDKVGALAPIFAGLGGVNVDWIVWSVTHQAATKVDHWWVDDEWDIQRRRGLKPTTRTQGTTGG